MQPGYSAYCKKDKSPFFPPFSRLPPAIEDLPETLDDAIEIAYVCMECGHYDKYKGTDFRRAMIPGLLGTPNLLHFWRGEYRCVHKGCGLQITVHTSAHDFEVEADVFQRIFGAQPSPTCGNGHAIQTDGTEEISLWVPEILSR